MYKDDEFFDFALNKLGLYQEYQLGSVKTESKQFVYNKNKFELTNTGSLDKLIDLRYLTDFDKNNRGNIREKLAGKLFPDLEITGIDPNKLIPNTKYKLNDIIQIRQKNNDIAKSTYKMNNYINENYDSKN